MGSARHSLASLPWPILALLSAFLLVTAGELRAPHAFAQSSSAPANLTAEADSCGVNLNWDAPTTNTDTVTGYRVLRATGTEAATTLVSDIASTDTAYSDSTAERGATYTYSVRALRSETASEASNQAEVEVPSTPMPTAVPVTAVPIVVTSTTDDYFVLYTKHEDQDAREWEYAVAVTRGEAGTTTLSENIEALPKERYRVEKYAVANPADVDGDCIDDLTELDNLGPMNPVNPGAIDASDGFVVLPDHASFEAIFEHYPEQPVLPLHGKFLVEGLLLASAVDRPSVYFMSTAHIRHYDFARDVLGISPPWLLVRPQIAYAPELTSSSGARGVVVFSSLLYKYSFEVIERVYTLLAASMPFLDDNLAFWIPNHRIPEFRSELPQIQESRIDLVFDKDIFGDRDFVALNPAVGYGRLRELDPDDRPHPRDIVLYEALPNELPRVAGIISTAPQTPLSHINLRAVQNGIPNAFIRDAADDSDITDLVGRYVVYTVTGSGWNLRAASLAEINAYYESERPGHLQFPTRDLTVTAIKPLGEIGFDDWSAFGVKAANMAVLRTLGFPEGTVRDGFAIPFYFYDEFMKNTPLGEETVFGKGKGADEDKFTLAGDARLIDAVKAILAHPKFQTDFDIQDEMLDDLRDAIKDATSPQWIIDALTTMHDAFPEDTSLRYRSSTNNEDLPGFNGAGLYDSYTQHPEETQDDGIDKSFKQVLASLWTFRAFTEREFHRIDHLSAAMGILVHPNFSDELANGVAVSFDPTTNRSDKYYVNSQLGEDLVTNPDAHSIPEEVQLDPDDDRYYYISTSNLVDPGDLLLSEAQLLDLRDHLKVIHDRFEELYDLPTRDPFAMEIEFKITSDDILAIKQARPWVFETAQTFLPPQILLSEEALTLSEGDVTGSSYGVRLLTRPSQSVTVTISRTAGSDVTPRPSVLNFNSRNWFIAQTVTLSAAQDVDSDNDNLTITHLAAGGDYRRVIAELPVEVEDDDKTDITFDPGSLTIPEGRGATIAMRLEAPAPERLTVPILTTMEQGASRDDYSDVPEELAFETGDTEQAFRFSALEDGDPDNGERIVIKFGRLPASLSRGAPSEVSVTIIDPPPPPPPTITGPIDFGGGGGGAPSGPTPSDADFEWTVKHDIEALDAGHDTPSGMWSDGATLWLLQNGAGADDAVYAYDLDTGQRDEDREFELAERNRAPRGVWSDRTVIWISDSGQEKLFAHDLGSGERLPDRDLVLAARNGDARGIWSDGETMWVLDGRNDSLFAYGLSSGDLLAEYDLDSANSDPHGIWSDGVGVWVSDDGAKKLLAYRLPVAADDRGEEDLALERVRGEEFTTLSGAGNNSPRGIWADGDVMYVADANDGKVYSYNMPDTIDARLASLAVEGVDIGEFDPGETDYEGVPDDGVTQTTVAAEAARDRASVVIDPPDADEEAEGHQVALAGLEEVQVTVTSSDGSRERSYRVALGEAGLPASCLRGAVAEGFSLVVSAGGSVEELVACALSRDVTALYALHAGVYVSYILGAPDFVNRPLVELFAAGVPSLTPLIVASSTPSAAKPGGAGEEAAVESWPECLRGDIAEGFSLVLYEGGDVEDLTTCARSSDVMAVYALQGGEFVSYILGAPEFVNQSFLELFAEGFPSFTPLVAKK